MNDTPKLCLGTVQLGLPYGITNDSGKVNELEATKILELAASNGIEYLDTAQAYGSSEEVIGRCWPPSYSRRVISKLSPNLSSDLWEHRFQKTLDNLGIQSLDSFLVHDSKSLIQPEGSKLLNWLLNLRQRGLVKRIGVSIYDSLELSKIPLDHIQVVQLPFSIFDQRLLRDGTLDRLHGLGVAIHVRSIFLQGLALQKTDLLPTFLSASFRSHHANWSRYLSSINSNPIAASFGFLRSFPQIEAILFGTTSLNECADCLNSWKASSPIHSNALSAWSWHDHNDIDPRFWPSR